MAESWCHGLYDEVLSGSFINGHSTELLCHSRDTGKYTIEEISEEANWGIEFYEKIK